jgi:hypothetical protein
VEDRYVPKHKNKLILTLVDVYLVYRSRLVNAITKYRQRHHFVVCEGDRRGMPTRGVS